MTVRGLSVAPLTGADAAMIDGLIASQAPVGVTCRQGETKLMFAVPIASRTDDALVLRVPDDVQAIQRRSSYRIRIPQYCDLKVTAWKIAEDTDYTRKVPASAEVPLELRDISTGGLGIVLLPRDGKPPEMILDQRLRVSLNWNEIDILLEARLRLPKSVDPAHPYRCGIVFVMNEKDTTSRQNLIQLDKIISNLQREEARQAKRSATA